jgi:hypothetical protein
LDGDGVTEVGAIVCGPRKRAGHGANGADPTFFGASPAVDQTLAKTRNPMRHVVSLVAVLGCLTSPPAATGQQVPRACELLTRDLVTPLTENPTILDLIPPAEETLGTSGTACDYGAVRLQLFPGRGGTGTVSGSDFQPISDAGWSGFFRNNRDYYAELMVWTGEHSLTLQVSVPTGGTAEAIKPDVVGLANALIAKLP